MSWEEREASNQKEDGAKIQQSNDESRNKARLHNQRLVWQAPAHSCFTLNHILYTFPNLVIWGTSKSVVLNGRLPLVQTRFPFTRISFNSKMLLNTYLQYIICNVHKAEIIGKSSNPNQSR